MSFNREEMLKKPDLKVGDTFYMLGLHWDGWAKCYVREFVDDRIIFRFYGKHKQWWHYEIMWFYSFNLEVRNRRVVRTLKETK